MAVGRKIAFGLMLLAGLGTPVLWAHAILLKSNPGRGQVTGPDVSIELRFNVRIDAGRSRMTLLEPDGSEKSLALAVQKASEILTANASGLAAGSYRLRWQVLAPDGHLTRGEIPFIVKTPKEA